MKILLISVNLLLVLTGAGQEPFAYFKINIGSFHEKSETILDQYRFSSIIFFDNDIFYDKRDDSNLDFFIGGTDTLNVYLNIHPFPLSPDKVATIESGSIYGIRITEKNSGSEMRIFFRACEHIMFHEEIDISNLNFVKGIFFYDMPGQGKKYKAACGNTIDLIDISKHSISFKKLKAISSKNDKDLSIK